MIRISDLEFSIAKADFFGELSSNDLSWGMWIHGTPKDVKGVQWHPVIGSEDLLGLHDKPIKKWTDILNYSLSWSDWFDEEQDRPNALIGVFEHCGVYDSSIHFGERQGNRFRLQWNAKCDVFFDRERYYDNLDLSIDAQVTFLGIFTDIEPMSRESAISALSRFLDPHDFQYCEEHPEELRPCFLPLPEP
jgi:hypothetical protein